MVRRIFISALQAYCRVTRLAVTLERHGDIYTITDSDVRCRYLSDQSASLDPRLVFPLEGGLAYIRAEDLQPLGDGAEFRLQEIEKDGSVSLALRARTWDELAADMAAKIGREALEANHTGALADLQREAGNVKAAIGSYSAAARMDSRYPDPWLALHEIAREQGQDGLARRYKGIHDRLATR